MTFEVGKLDLSGAEQVDLHPKIDGVKVYKNAGYGDKGRKTETVYIEVTGGTGRHIYQVNARAKFTQSKNDFETKPYLSVVGGSKPLSAPGATKEERKSHTSKIKKWTFLHDGFAENKENIWIDGSSSSIAQDDGSILRFFDRPSTEFKQSSPMFLNEGDWAKFLAYTFIVRDKATIGVVKWSIKQDGKETSMKIKSVPVTHDVIEIGLEGIRNHNLSQENTQLGFVRNEKILSEMVQQLPGVPIREL